ncbi:MAG: cobalamin-binding protein [Vulcanimicrobiaceae bacterium]
MKIVSLLPSATEICFALGLGDDVVGVTHECDYPPEVREKPKLTRSNLPQDLQTHPGASPPPNAERSAQIDRHVRSNVHEGSSLYDLDAELLERLKPDLIITQELCAVCAVSYEIVSSAAKRLGAAPHILSLEPTTLEGIYDTILTVAEFANVSEKGKRVVELLRAGEDAIRVRTRKCDKPRTLLLEWTSPPMGGGHWVADLLELAGAEPVLVNRGGDSQAITWDAIAEADPDAIFVAPCGYDVRMAKEAIAAIGAEPDWAGLRAVRAGRAWAVDGNAYVNRPGPRVIRSAEIFAEALHPESFAGMIPVDGALARLTV